MGTSVVLNNIQWHLKHNQPFHDAVQIRHMIIGSNGHGSVWGQYRQVLRELSSRRGAYLSHDWDLRKAQIDRKVAERRMNAWWRWRTTRDLARIEWEQATETIEGITTQTEDLDRECALFLVIADELRRQLPADLGVTEVRDQLDQKYWVTKLSNQARQESRLGGMVSESLLHIMLHLPHDMFLDILNSTDGMVDSQRQVIRQLRASLMGQTAVDAPARATSPIQLEVG